MTQTSSSAAARPTILIAPNDSSNALFGLSAGELISPYVTSTYELIGGVYADNTLIGDVYTLAGYGYNAGNGYAAGLVGGNVIVGGAHSSNFMVGSAYQILDTIAPPLGYNGKGPKPGEIDYGHNTLKGGDYASNYGYGDACTVDALLGAGGSNTLIGGAHASNALAGDAYSIHGDLSVTGGDNTLTGGAYSSNFLFGDAWIIDGKASGGSNRLTGGAYSTNYEYGGAQHLSGGAATSHNVVAGGLYSTNYEFGDGQELDGSTGGSNIVTGGANSTNFLYGDALTANLDHGRLSAGGGNTVIAGLNSTNYLWGGVAENAADLLGAANTFVIGSGDGLAYIEDFRHGVDKIDLKGYAGLASFAQLSIAYSGGNAILHIKNDTLEVLNDIKLTAADFKFG